MNTNGAPTDNEPTVAKSVQGLAHDVIELSELQARLLVLDLQATSRTLRIAAIIACIALAVLLGCIPVALMALAEVLVEQAGWSRSLGLATAALVGLLVSGTLLAVVRLRLKRFPAAMRRSQDELTKNVAWLKSALRGGTSSPSKERTTGNRV